MIHHLSYAFCLCVVNALNTPQNLPDEQRHLRSKA